MAIIDITTKEYVEELSESDSLFVNYQGSLRQIEKSKLHDISKLDVNQGAENAEKILTINDEGNIIPSDMPYIPREVLIDKTLNIEGQAADSKKVGEALQEKANLSDIPDKLPTPNKLIFTGAINDEYDGSSEKTINLLKKSDITPDSIGAVESNGGDISNTIVTFQKATEMANIASGDSIATALGKLAKLYEELEERNVECWSLSGGTAIEENSDLNDSAYLAVGNYYCPTTSAAETLLNCPVGNAFTMKVELSAGISIVRQTIRPYNTGDVYVRILSNDGSSLIFDWTLIAADQSKKVDASKIVESTEITEPGFLMDGKTASEKFTAVSEELSGKQDVITGGASTIATKNLAAKRALISNSGGNVAVASTTVTELEYLHGVKSNVQTQIDNKNNLRCRTTTHMVAFEWTGDNKFLIIVDNAVVATLKNGTNI